MAKSELANSMLTKYNIWNIQKGEKENEKHKWLWFWDTFISLVVDIYIDQQYFSKTN